MMKFVGNTYKNRFLLAAIAVAFFYYLFGFQILNPFYTEWLNGNDSVLHFGGLNYFLQEPWQWPLGKINGYSFPMGTSVVFTDSIPWLSFLVKIFQIYPNSPLQFYGLWILVCFLLQVLLGYELILRFGREEHVSKWNAFFGALIFLFFPAFLFRTFENTRHYTLLAHFLVMLMLIAVEADLRLERVRRFLWFFLAVLTLGIQLYFTAFVLILWLGLELQQKNLLEEFKKPKVMLFFSLASLFLFLLMDAVGYFVVDTKNVVKEGGFGSFSMNLFSWMNSEGFSNLFMRLPTRSYEQREGVTYLGLGIIALILQLFSQAKTRRAIKQEARAFLNSPFGAVFIFIFLFSLSPRITALGITIPDGAGYGIYAIVFYFTYKRMIKGEHPEAKAIALVCVTLLFYFYFGRTFRSSGRFAWCLSYALVAYLIRFPTVRWVLPAVFALQLADLTPLIQAIRSENQKIYIEAGKLKERSPLMDEVFKDVSQVKIIKQEQVDRIALTHFVVERKIPTGPLYKARRDAEVEKKFEQETQTQLLKGNLEEHTLYVIGDAELFQQMSTNLKFEFNGFRVLKKAKADSTH